MSAELEDQADLSVRLRVALSLCPVDALTHRRSDRISRLEKIRRHLVSEDLVPPDLAVRLAEAVDRTLDAWLVQRENVAGFRAQLLARDGDRCRSCGVKFGGSSEDIESVRARDPYKLAWVDPDRHYEATVDHREPVSKFGTNDVDNLWLLCRFCNEGKGDGSPLLLKHELHFATALPLGASELPEAGLLAHSARLVYRVLARQRFACSLCGDQESELTIRKIRRTGLAVLSNMTSVCIDCSVVNAGTD